MPTGARIVITAFASTSSPKIAPWREHSARVAGVVLGAENGTPRPAEWAPSIAGQPAVWHLTNANHRMLARSVTVFDSALAAVADATATLAAHGELEAALVRDRGGSALGWLLRLGADPIVACARWYSTDRDRRKSLDTAIDALVGASVAPLVRAAHPLLGGAPLR